MQQEFEELFSSTKSAIDSMRVGIKSIADEEQQLLMLRNQLSKIKKIREEQHKKDALIASLKERLAVLEHAATNSTRQFAEVQGIMTERIHSLERYVAEKEALEHEYRERILLLDEKCHTLKFLEDDLLMERKKSAQLQQLHDKLSEELNSAHGTIASDRQVSEHLKALFESLREELRVKEAELDVFRRREAAQDTAMYSDLTTTRTRLDEVVRSYKQCDDVNRQYERSLGLCKVELAALKEERRILQQELDVSRRREEEHLTTCRELQSTHSKIAAKAEENEQSIQHYRSALLSLADNLHYMCTMMESHNEDVSQERVISELHGRLQDMAKTLDSVDVQLPSRDLQRIVKSVSQFTSILLDYRQVTIEVHQQLQRKTTSYENVNAAFQDVEEKFSAVLHDSIMADNLVASLVAWLEKAGLVGQESSAELDGEESRRVSSSVLDAVSFKLAKRETAYSRLTQGVARLLEAFPYRQRYAALQREHSETLQRNQKMQDEALLAVQVSTSETQRSADMMHHDYTRKLREQQDQHEQEVEEIRSALSLMVSQYQQALLCLQRVVLAAEEQEDRIHALQSIANINHRLLHGYAILARDVKTIACLSQPGGEGLAAKLVHGVKPKTSFKAAAIAVLAANRIVRLLRQARDRQFHTQQAHDLLLKKFQIDNGSPRDIVLFAQLWALPPLQDGVSHLPARGGEATGYSPDRLVQYLRNLLAMKAEQRAKEGGSGGGKSYTSLLQTLTQSHRAARSIASGTANGTEKSAKQLFGQNELNAVHAKLLQLSQQQTLWQERYDKAQATLVATEQRLADCHEQARQAQEANKRLQLDLQLVEAKLEAAQAATTAAQAAQKVAEALREERTSTTAAESAETKSYDNHSERRQWRTSRRYESNASEQDESFLSLSQSLYKTSKPPARRAEEEAATFSEHERDEQRLHRREAISRLEARRRDASKDIEATARTLRHARMSRDIPPSHAQSHAQPAATPDWEDSGAISAASSGGDWSFRKHVAYLDQNSALFDSSLIHSRTSTPPRRRESESFTQTPSRGEVSMTHDTSFGSHSSSRESTGTKFLRINSAERAKNELRDVELLEIYSDIGRLTGRLETRLRHSHVLTPSPESSLHK